MWTVSYVLLWATVLFLSVVVVALLRQVGVLHARLQPLGAHPAGEGPPEGEPAPPVPGGEYPSARLTLVAFVSPTCTVCAALVPSLRALETQYAGDRVRVVTVDYADAAAPAVFAAFAVRSTPYVVAVDAGGVVRGKGVVNSLEQVEVLVEHAHL